MAGVRGFQDPNVHISSNTNKTVFHQPVSSSASPAPPSNVNELLPFYINAQGGDSNDRYQCMTAGSNGWAANHAYWDKGQIDRATSAITPYSMGYYKRQDIPFHYALADAFTIGDAYHESVIAETNPNRVSWGAATNGILQSQKGLNGPTVSNYEGPGCSTSPDGTPYSCFPFKWKTVPEYFEQVGITWQVYQDEDNFDDNPFAWFESYLDAPAGSNLAERGTAHVGLEKFYADAKAGTLPQVSYIVGPTDLSEHPPYGPLDGAWLQEQVVNAVLQSPKYESTALIISYDETGGFADHVVSPLPPQNTPGESITDFYNASLGVQPNGPGFRVPLVLVSPWTRGGKVFTEVASHESQTLFLEKWSEAIGKPFTSAEMTAWRRSQLSDLVNAFDFSKSDTSAPALPSVRQASQDSQTGEYNGAAVCQAKYPSHQPPVPYGKQTEANSLVVEKGFKQVVGNPTEGHFIVFEANGQALSYLPVGPLSKSPAVSDHSPADQRFILHAAADTPSNTIFTISTSSQPTRYVTANLQLTNDSRQAAQFAVQYKGNGQGHTIIEKSSGKAISMNGLSPLPELNAAGSGFDLYSVTG
jgi:phospholipase C